jgi:putative DNA primase/helicase
MHESSGPLENGLDTKKELPAPIITPGQAPISERLFYLFEGYEHSHGQCDVTGFKDNGKAIANAKTHKTPATIELWRRHLDGTYGLGVVPLRQDGTCSWGACDLDDYETDAGAIAARVAALGIPALVNVSRSGGKHVFIWARIPVRASEMRQRLAEVAKALGYPDAECFPKQDSPTECGGSWLNMPWHGGENSRRYGIMPNGDTYTLAEWVDAAERLKAATGPEWFSTPLSVPSAPASTGLKGGCKKGFTLPAEIAEGRRDTTLASAAGKMRRAGFGPDEILAAMRQMNQERCKPPLADADVVRIAKSIGRKQPAPMDEDAGLTKGLASAITANDHFARDAGGRLYHWSGGVYLPTGERFVAKQVKALCDEWQMTKSWTPELATRVEQWIAVDCPDLLECPPMDTLNCRNGLLDIATRTLRPHSPDHLSAVQIAADFDPAATCPHIDRFVADVFPDDAHHLTYEVAGWLILPNKNLQKAVLLLGEGSNGKSGWLNLMQNLLGRSNVSALTLHKLEADKFAMARLVGKLANICADLPTSALAGTSMFKALTGNDLVSAERKFEASFEFRPFARLLFSANSAPRSEDATHGFFRRWLVIPFTRQFDEADPNTIPPEILNARLSQPGELSGLLNKALDALPAIRKGRFTETASTRAALEEFRATTDPMSVWLDANTVERPDAMVPKDRLRSMYGQACHEAGRPILGDVQFTAALKRLRPKVEPARRYVNKEKIQVFLGLGLLTQDPVPGGLGF